MTGDITRERYARADSLQAANLLDRLVHGAVVTPRFIGQSDRFWVSVETSEGRDVVVVDPVTGTVDSPVDFAKAASALATQHEIQLDPTALAAATLAVAEHGAVTFNIEGKGIQLDPRSMEFTATDVLSPAERMERVESPCGRRAVVLSQKNLVVIDNASGQRTQLTDDGSRDRPYAAPSDASRLALELKAHGFREAPHIAWNRVGSRFATFRLDQRGVVPLFLTQSTPPNGGRPITHRQRFAMPGDPYSPTATMLIADVERNQLTPVKLDPIGASYLTPVSAAQLYWDQEDTCLYVLDFPDHSQQLRLFAVDPETGGAHLLIEEKADATFVEPGPIIGTRTWMARGDTLVWWSERDGFGQLYNYDATSGELRCRITDGGYVVHQVLALDVEEGLVWFIASGREGGDPYLRRFYRAALDGSDVELLDADVADHEITASPSGRFFIDTISTIEDFGRTVVRDRQGRVIVEVTAADATDLSDSGFRAPIRFSATAADGVTEIWGNLWLPEHFSADDEHATYPVLDDIYPGPQINRAMPALGGSRGGYAIGDAAALAQLGFVVMQVDGRGSPLRHKAFHDWSYGRLGGNLDDHEAALRQLAARFPQIDLERVGIFGHSGGGHASAKAMMTHPHLFKVAVSSAGNHDSTVYNATWGSRYQGPADEERYAQQATHLMADRLVGKLLLIHGELDDNVHMHHTMKLVDRLVEANKDFELLVLPNVGHGLLGRRGYSTRRRWDFFVRHLLGVEPPQYQLTEPPLNLTVT